jgi:hypothetical protein
MRTAGAVALVLVLLATPLSSACYAPRVQGCRDPITDFSSFGTASIVDALGFTSTGEGGVGPFQYRIRASTTSVRPISCVAVHSEVRIGSSVIDTMDTPIRASIVGGVMQTTWMFHYHVRTFPVTLHVETLGQTIETTVDRLPSPPDVGLLPDAAATFPDVGP